jgi:gas vesicle protein
MSVTPTRKTGEKGKRSPTNDSPEERRHRKKTNRTTEKCILPIISEKSDNESSEIDSDSDLDLIAPSSSTRTKQGCAKKKSVLMTMSEINNFSALLRNAFLDPETATAMRTVFKPLLDEQTQMIKEEMKEIKENHTKLEQRTENLEEKVTHLQEENSTLRKTFEQQQRFLESVDYDRR